MQILKVFLELDGAKKNFMINKQIATKRRISWKENNYWFAYCNTKFFQKGIK